MILGISGSGRSDGITAEAVQTILKTTDEEYEYITLSGKQINGCIGCTRCAGDNICKQKDDWNEIGQKMLQSEAIVFGAPDYYGMINALAHACLERTYCFRHREVFKLAGKLGMVVGVDGNKQDSAVIEYIKKIMKCNQMVILDALRVEGYSQCYTCGHGETCAAGAVVARHGFIDSIEEWHLPEKMPEQDEGSYRVYKAGKILGSILRDRRKQE